MSARLSLRKNWDLGNNLLNVQLDTQYTGERFFGLANEVKRDGFTVANAFVGLEFGSEQQYRVTAWGKNIFDRRYWVNYSPRGATANFGLADTLRYADPRTYGITFRAEF